MPEITSWLAVIWLYSCVWSSLNTCVCWSLKSGLFLLRCCKLAKDLLAWKLKEKILFLSVMSSLMWCYLHIIHEHNKITKNTTIELIEYPHVIDNVKNCKVAKPCVHKCIPPWIDYAYKDDTMQCIWLYLTFIKISLVLILFLRIELVHGQLSTTSALSPWLFGDVMIEKGVIQFHCWQLWMFHYLLEHIILIIIVLAFTTNTAKQ